MFPFLLCFFPKDKSEILRHQLSMWNQEYHMILSIYIPLILFLIHTHIDLSGLGGTPEEKVRITPLIWATEKGHRCAFEYGHEKQTTSCHANVNTNKQFFFILVACHTRGIIVFWIIRKLFISTFYTCEVVLRQTTEQSVSASDLLYADLLEAKLLPASGPRGQLILRKAC